MKPNLASRSKNSKSQIEQEIDAILMDDAKPAPPSKSDESMILSAIGGDGGGVLPPPSLTKRTRGPAKPKLKAGERPTDVADWEPKHLYAYTNDRFRDVFGIYMAITRPAGTTFIRHLKLRFSAALGDGCGMVCVKAYIDWFFATVVPQYQKKRQAVDVGTFKFPKHIQDYLLLQGQQASVEEPVRSTQNTQVQPISRPESATVDEIAKKLKISFQGVLLSYGLVVSINYLIGVRRMSLESALSLTVQAVTKGVRSDKKFWVNLLDATEHFGPYPSWLKWRDVTGIARAVESSLGGNAKLKSVEVKSCDDNVSLAFLK